MFSSSRYCRLYRLLFIVAVLGAASGCDFFSGLSGGSTPPVPENLCVDNPTATSLRLSWKTAGGAQTYELYRDTSSTGTFSTRVYSAGSVSYTDSGLSSGTTYYYKVRAVNARGSSAFTEAVSGTTGAQPQTVRYELTVQAGDGGAVSPSGSMMVDTGAATIVSATPGSGYAFASWTTMSGNPAINSTTSAMTTVTLTGGDATVQAVFAAASVLPDIHVAQGATDLEDNVGVYSFGSVGADGNGGLAGAQVAFTIQNLGNGALTVTGISLTGGDSADFDLTPFPSITVPAYASTGLTLRFDPLTIGDKQTTVTILNDDPDPTEATYTFVVTGKGVAPAPAEFVWTERQEAGLRLWNGIASSADGGRLVASEDGGFLYTSADSGFTWTEQTNSGKRAWCAVVSSTDGSNLAGAVYEHYIHTSNDYGVTWVQRTSAGARGWESLSTSADGSRLAASAWSPYGIIWTASDYGATWTEQQNTGGMNWECVASSADGGRLVAAVWGGAIYTSADYGVTWALRDGAPSGAWRAVASSADGQWLFAGLQGGYLWTSCDGGENWTEQTTIGPFTLWHIACSADGRTLIADDVVGVGYGNPSYLYTSRNYGITWTRHDAAPAGPRMWTGVGCSADGSRVFGVDYGGYIYTAVLESAD